MQISEVSNIGNIRLTDGGAAAWQPGSSAQPPAAWTYFFGEQHVGEHQEAAAARSAAPGALPQLPAVRSREAPPGTAP